MDRVRFGRALGYGARHAAKTLAAAARAASAPSSAPTASARTQTSPPEFQNAIPTRQRAESPVGDAIRDAGASVLEAQRAYTQATQRTRAGAANAGRSLLAPVKRAGGVLWLEMTGSIFALFALFLAPGVWKLRDALHAPLSSSQAHKFYGYMLIFAVFVYFAVSSFVRANRRGKRS